MVDFLALIQSHPRTSIILFSLVVTFFITIINFFMIDRQKMREIKEKQKGLQEQMKVHKDNPQKLAEINKEMFSHMGDSMKHSFKPMIVTMIPLLIIFAFFRSTFASTEIAKSWIWYYIGFSIVFSIILRKIFKLD